MKNKAPIISWILLAITTAIFIYIRLRLLSLPLERDEGEYAYAGQQILHGGIPYRDVYNMKFPGVYYLYALIITFFGNTITGIRLGALLINLLTAFFILKAGEKLKNLTTGVFAAATFIILSSAPHFQGILCNAEHFVNLFIAISAYFLFSWMIGKKNIQLLVCGIAAGFACLMKQHGAYFILVAIVAVVVSAPLQQKYLLKLFQNTFILMTGFIIVMLLLLTVVLTTGAFDKFIFFTIKYGSRYIAYTSFSNGITHFIISFANDIRNNHPIWILVLVAAIFSFKLLPKQTSAVLLAWLILSILSVFPGYYFREHYFLLLTPVSAVYSGMLFNYLISWRKNLPAYIPKLSASLLFVFTVVYLLIGERRIFFSYTPAEASASIYHCDMFNEAVTVADSIRYYLPLNKPILNIGNEPEIYFYTNRIASSGYVYMYPMTERQPWRDSMLSELTHQAVRNKPAVIVVSRQWPYEIPYQQKVLTPLMTSTPGYYLKGICYKTGNNKDAFLWNSEYNSIAPDSIIWEVYIRKN